MKNKSFRIGDRVKVIDNEFPEMKKKTYTVVGFGNDAISIEDINGKQYKMLPSEIDLLNPELREEEHKAQFDIKEALDAMYYHTKKGNVTYYWMVASVFGLYALTHVGIVAVALAMIALILGLAQNLWQGITLEVFCRKLDAEGKKDFDYYPDHISNGGWIIYCLKMAVIVASGIAFIIETI